MSELNSIINQIDELKVELDALRPIPKDRWERIWQKFRLDWNFHSNHIEGNSLTFGETKTFLLHGITAGGKPLKDHLDIKGHNDALLLIQDVVNENRPLTERFIRELHTMILKEPYENPAETPDGQATKRKIRIGEYKSQPNHVKTKTGEIFYFASPEETPAKMEDLMKWYRENSGELHPLLLAAGFHYTFIRIHPFDDGNGRIARILMNFILMQKNFPPVIISTDDKENYFAALQQADGGNLEAFTSYIGHALLRSMDLMLKGAKGEEIEEVDDLAKRISIIEARIIEDKFEKSVKELEEGALLDVLILPSIQYFPFFLWKHLGKLIRDLVPKKTILKYRSTAPYAHNTGSILEVIDCFSSYRMIEEGYEKISVEWSLFYDVGLNHLQRYFQLDFVVSLRKLTIVLTEKRLQGLDLVTKEFGQFSIGYNAPKFPKAQMEELGRKLANSILDDIEKSI